MKPVDNYAMRCYIQPTMVMQLLESELRRTGEPQDAARADEIAAMLKSRGQDIPLSGKEGSSGIKRFSKEAKAILETSGFKVFELTGKTKTTIPALGGQINDGDLRSWPQMNQVESRRSEVAIRWPNPFLPDSEDQDIDKQMAQIRTFGRHLKETVPDVKAILGNALDYAELAARSEELLFDGSTRTTTLLPWAGPYGSGNYIVTIGQCDHPQIGKETIFFGLTHGEPQNYEHIAPIIIPR
jgi:hypothetical protein